MLRPTPVTLDVAGIDKHFSSFTKSQQAFVNIVKDWVQRPRKMNIILSGGPGTGKTYIVLKTLEFIQTSQLRMAHTQRSARAIKGRTVHSTVHLDWSPQSVYKQLEAELEYEKDINLCIEKSRVLLTEFDCTRNPYIIVVDEVSMINGWTVYWLVRYFMDKTTLPLLFIMMGDRHQLYPVKSKKNVFSCSNLDELYESHRICLTESKRFEAEYQILMDNLRMCVDQDNGTDLTLLVDQYFPIVESVNTDLLSQATRCMAFLNTTVNEYNEFYINQKLPGENIRLYRMNMKDREPIKTEYVDIKTNCLIFVTKSNSSVPIGSQLLFKRYDPDENVNVLHCLELATGDNVKVYRNKEGNFPFDLGFASTIHKFQRQTMDDEKIIINFDGNWDLNLVYTALSRVKNMKEVLAICW